MGDPISSILSTGSKVLNGLTPDMPNVPQPKAAPTPDDKANKAAKRRKYASKTNTGRASTVLTQGGEKLG